MNKIKISIIALAAILSSGVAHAQDNYRPWQVGASLSTIDIRVPDGAGDMIKDWFGYPDMNYGFRLAASRYIKKGITTELGFTYASFTKDHTYFPDAKNTISGRSFWSVDLRGRYHLNRLWSGTPWLDPYPQIGIGYSSIGDINKVNLVAGLGVNFWFSDVLGANLQTSYNPAFGGKVGENYFQWNVGVVLKLPLIARENPIVDHVERIKEPKEKKERKKLSENKPITRIETPEEREERTIRVTKEINLYAKTILFDVDKAIVKTQAEFILDNIAKIMQENEDFNFVVEGHTDNTGTPEHNLQLSQDRADAIKNYLVSKGIAANRLNAIGYGQTRPLESNDTERGKEINRRVEINVVKQEIIQKVEE